MAEAYLPAAHEEHEAAPDASEYEPAGQERQLDAAVAPAVERYLPAAQLVQIAEPDDVE